MNLRLRSGLRPLSLRDACKSFWTLQPISYSLVFVLLICGHRNARAQQTSVNNVVKLTAFEQQIVNAFAPDGSTFQSMTLTGSVDRRAGSTRESGSVKLMIAVDGSSSEEWSGVAEGRSVHRTALADRTCTLKTGSLPDKQFDGVACQRVLPWFAGWALAPFLSASILQANETQGQAGTTIVAILPQYVGLEALSAKAQKRVQAMQQQASFDALFDSSTALASGVQIKDPLLTGSGGSLETSVVYTDYRSEHGFMVPHRIQRYVQRSLESDITIDTVVLN